MPDQTNTAEAVERLTWVSGTKTGNPQYGVVVAVEDLSVVLKDYVQRGCDIDEAKGLLEASDRENHRLRSRIMELEKALGPSQEQRNAENLVAIREAIIVREIRMRTEQLRFDAANPDFGDRYQREVAAALADQFDEFADSLEAAPPPASPRSTGTLAGRYGDVDDTRYRDD